MADQMKSDRPPPGPAEAISDHFELLAVMGRDFAATLDIEDTVARALARITRHLNAAGGALFLLDEDGATLTCQACYGATEITGLTIEAGQGIVGRCVNNNAGEIIGEVEDDPDFLQSVDQKTGFTTRSILCAPMSVKDQRIGAIELVNKQDAEGMFTPDDLHLLQALSSSAALAILNARMAEAMVAHERVRRELELAAEIQRSLLPQAGGEDYPVHGVNVPARMVSGDFYDIFPLDDGRICFNLADVSGKGMNAALLMAKTASLYRCLGKTMHQPGTLLAQINAEICETATRGMFVTMVGGVYDPATGVVRLANAGHEPPLYRDARGGFTEVPAAAPPLGVSPLLSSQEDFPETELKLDGGTLYIFTDGVTEGYLENGGEMTAEGFKELINANASLTVAERLAAVVGRIDRGDGALRDDITVLAIEDKGQMKNRKTESNAADALSKGLIHLDDHGDEPIEGERLIKIKFLSLPTRLKLVRGAVAEAVKLCGCGTDVTRDVVIAVDEACQNVIRHAYQGAPDGEVVLEVRREDDQVVILLRDFARAVDVKKIKPRDLDDLRPGGLGTHFIREVMDEVDFMPLPISEGGLLKGNLLRMVKRI